MTPEETSGLIWLITVPSMICLIIGIAKGVIDSPLSSDSYKNWLFAAYTGIFLVYLIAILT